MKTQLALGCSIAFAVGLCAHSFAADTNDYAGLTKQFMDAFAKAEVGQDVSKLVLPKGWTDKALIQVIDFQTGKWYVWIEDGMTVLRIYPYYDKSEGEKRRAFLCVVLKVDKESVTVEQMVEAFAGHRSGEPLRLAECSVEHSDGNSVYRSKKKKDKR